MPAVFTDLNGMVRSYIGNLTMPGINFSGTSYQAETGKAIMSFWIEVPMIDEHLQNNPGSVSKHINGIMQKAFGENSFANTRLAALQTENEKLLQKNNGLEKQVEYLGPFKQHFDLAFALAHGKKNDIR